MAPDLEQRIERLESVEQIRQLVSRYALALDSRDVDTLVSLFVDDVHVGRDERGREALAAWFDPILRPYRITFHLIGNHIIDFDDDDHARGVVYCRPEHEVGDLWVVMPMQYWDKYERRDGRWFFAQRRPVVFYAADVLEHPLQVEGRFHFPNNPMIHRAELPEKWESWQRFWSDPSPEPEPEPSGEPELSPEPASADRGTDWDAIAPEYHDRILGPFAPEMTERGPGGRRRNILLDELDRLDIPHPDIVDFGCGPGNLIPHLPRHVAKLAGIDQSREALDLARGVANRHGVALEAYCGDYGMVELPRHFDVVVTVNAVVPARRSEVVEQFAAMRRWLKPSGRLLAILPSYDSTRYLRELIAAEDGEDAARAWDARKRSDDDELLFADDDTTPQAFHTPESIRKELGWAGFRVVGDLRKVCYPWELTRRFDYGYFPDAPEEIWDWFVEAVVDR